MNKKKLCIIVPTLKMGGMERVVCLLSNYSVANGFHVSIICLLKSKVAYELDDRVDVIQPKFDYKAGLMGKAKVFFYLTSALLKIKPTVALSFSEVFNPLSIISSRISNVPIYISDRSNPHVNLRSIIQLLRKFIYPFAAGMIAQTQTAKSVALEKKYNKNIAVIANPLRQIEESNIPVNKNIIISVGRLIATKNFSELIDIFSEVDSMKSWELWILGDGPEKNVLQGQINSNGLGDHVKLIGAVKNVDDYLSQATIFAFTSVSEGFPNALSEAIAYPLACIAYNCPAGPSDLIRDNENGFLIPLGDKECYKIHLNTLMINASTRKRIISDYELHREKYHIDNISIKYLSFLFD
ncbi:glycosyltransferase [Pseudoalteromonas arctica]|uniref:Glycosyl transferase family 1 domain-containing protein n=1 Tax=Pseudoalteromonas arctica A 37-1-2 TaxID=1117313 RepID=A0A290RZP8_9GAMM|nr:glycosyltransferase [Pseudoalteromonas arctica]ATC85299.1 hypothetical protein PARC_a0580 [Pseudoalteromonas arctica A 37-1-2]